MDLPSRSEIILSKMNVFYRVNSTDSDDTVKHALQQLLIYWSDVLGAADSASDDELFALNVSRAFLTKVFTIAITKDCFMNDHSFTHQILRTCFDLLVNHIDIFTNTNVTSVTIFFISNICLIMIIASNLISLVRCTDIDFFEKNEDQLLIAMREHVDHDFTHDNLTDGIISFIWNLSDNTLLVPLLLKANYAQSLIEWIENCETKFREDKQLALIYILLNMVRHDDGIDQFNALDALDVIEYIPIYSTLTLQRTMIYILLTNANKIKFESLESLTMLVQLTVDAAKNEKYRYEGSHVCEPLTVLTKLFYNDEILHIILCNIETKPPLTTQSMIELFASLVMKFYPNLTSNNGPLENFTCVLVLNILSLISYHEEYNRIIYDNEPLMNIIKNAANSEKNFVDTFMPRTMKNIQQAAIETLNNLH